MSDVIEHVDADRVEGHLMIGHNLRGEVVVNLPDSHCGHVVFSPRQARQLAATLIQRAADAEEVRDEQQSPKPELGGAFDAKMIL